MSTAPFDLARDAGVKYPGFFSIPVETLRTDIPLGYQVHIEIAGKLLLYHQRGALLTRERRDKLVDRERAVVYVPDVDHVEYYRYVEDEISDLLCGEGLTDEDKVARFYTVGDTVTRFVVNDPTSSRSKSLAQRWVGETEEWLQRENGILGNFVELLDPAPDLYQHSLHVCLFGLALASSSNIGTVEDRQDFGVGLLIHDLGLLSLPNEWRQRPGPLLEKEWERVRRHPEAGAEKALSAPWIGPIAREVIAHHHERLDGSGYPHGLMGGDIGDFARVAAIANHVESRTADRPYRAARSSADVLREMLSEQSAGFDLKLLASFVRAFKNVR